MLRSAVRIPITAEDRTKAAFSSATRGLQRIKSVAASVMGPVAALASVGGFSLLIKKTMEAGDQFDKMSKRTGVSVEWLSALSYAADINGVKIETLLTAGTLLFPEPVTK